MSPRFPKKYPPGYIPPPKEARQKLGSLGDLKPPLQGESQPRTSWPFGGLIERLPRESSLYIALLDAMAKEITADGYERQRVSFAAASGGATFNEDPVEWNPLADSSWPSIHGAAVYDAYVGGNLIASMKLSSPIRATRGTTVQFPIGGINIGTKP